MFMFQKISANVIFFATLLLVFWHLPCQADNLIVKSKSGKYIRYEDYTIVGVYDEGVKVAHANGFAKVPLANLPPSVARKWSEKVRQEKLKSIEAKKTAPQSSSIAKAEENVFNTKEPHVIVSATGRGLDETEALRDAYKDAVRKAVGTYVVTQTVLKNDKLDEIIMLNSDAIIIRHEVTNKRTENGVLIMDITATVVKNELQKYIAPKKTSKINTNEISNLLNHREALANAEKSLEYIFEKYIQNLFHATKKGNLQINPHSKTEGDRIIVDLNYDVQFNKKAYDNLKQRLHNLLERTALTQKQSACSSMRDLEKQLRLRNNKDSKIIVFTEVDKLSDWRYANRKYSREKANTMKYHAYAVPAQIWAKLNSLIDHWVIIEFNFHVRGEEEPVRKFRRRCKLNLFETRHINGCEAIIIKDWTNRISHQRLDYNRKATYELSEDIIKNLKKCEIKIYSGK